MRKIKATLYSTYSPIDINIDDIVNFNNDRWSVAVQVRTGLKESSMFVSESMTEIVDQIVDSYSYLWQVGSGNKPKWLDYLLSNRIVSFINDRLCVNKFNYYVNNGDYLAYDDENEEAFLIRAKVIDIISLFK